MKPAQATSGAFGGGVGGVWEIEGTGTTEAGSPKINVGVLHTAPDGTGVGSVSETARSDPPPIWSQKQGPLEAP